MTVQEVIDMAKYGELSNISVKDDVDAVLSYLNLGMLELYKRFPLRVEEYLLELVEGQIVYTMPDGFMWIVSAYGEVPEDDQRDFLVLPINKEDDPMSINTVGWNQVQIPVVSDGAYIAVMYVAAPTTYTASELSDTIEIPPQMVEALLQYIAYKAYSGVTSGDQEDMSLYQKFEASCDKILTKGMFNQDDLYMDDRITTKGFV